MAKLKAIQNHIIFQFEDGSKRHQGITQFEEKTDWDFTYTIANEGMETGRWVRVTHVGHKVPDEIKPGMRICVDKLKWTSEFEVDGELYARTDYDQVLLIDESVVV